MNTIADYAKTLVSRHTYHSFIKGKECNYLYSTLDLTLPVVGGKTERVQLRRKIVADSGDDQNNEQESAVTYFTGTVYRILDGYDTIDVNDYADDEDSYDIQVGTRQIDIDQYRIEEPVAIVGNFANSSLLDFCYAEGLLKRGASVL